MLSGWFHGPHRAGGAGYAVVDLEASGPSPRRHRVVEVAVVLLDGHCRIENEFTTLLDPGGPVGPTHIHGIARDDVGGAPRFAEIAAHLLGLLGGRDHSSVLHACEKISAEIERNGPARNDARAVRDLLR